MMNVVILIDKIFVGTAASTVPQVFCITVKIGSSSFSFSILAKQKIYRHIDVLKWKVVVAATTSFVRQSS